jgi:5-methyltetrahydropteroyltriglutamate--homocysteine methyltransferase
MFADGASVIREEIAELIDLGCEYIQIDAPELAVIGTEDRWARDFAQRSGLPVDRMLAESAELLNAIVDGLDGPTYGLHLCRGNNEGRWMASGGYDRLARDVLARMPAFDVFLLEYEDERSGGFDALADLPQDKVIVLGVVSTKHAGLEPLDQLVAKVDAAARFFPKEQLAVSTQCGFASMFPGNPITAPTQYVKLARVVDLAGEVWGETATAIAPRKPTEETV